MIERRPKTRELENDRLMRRNFTLILIQLLEYNKII
jgi:hypothetical protein